VGRRLLLLCLLPLGLLLAACGGTTSSTPATPTTTTAVAHTTAVTIQVTSIVTKTQAHNRVPNRTSKGDRVVFSDVLLNGAPQFGKKVNERIGTDSGTMTFTSKRTAIMTGVANLPDGTIIFRGDVTVLPNNRISVPVIGGTGKYANASGTLLVGSGLKRAPNTYTLVIGLAGPVA
jgi:hypothetical protein